MEDDWEGDAGSQAQSKQKDPDHQHPEESLQLINTRPVGFLFITLLSRFAHSPGSARLAAHRRVMSGMKRDSERVCESGFTSTRSSESEILFPVLLCVKAKGECLTSASSFFGVQEVSSNVLSLLKQRR